MDRPSGIASLPPDLLGVICKFFSLPELGQRMAVARAWPTAISKMHGLGLAIPTNEYDVNIQGEPLRQLVRSICRSRLSRHISTICASPYTLGSLTVEDITTFVAARMPHITGVSMEQAGNVLANLAPLTHLTTLRMRFREGSAAATIHESLVTISTLPALTDLTLTDQLHPAVSFAPLHKLETLQKLKLDRVLDVWSDTQIEEVRLLSRLHTLSLRMEFGTELAILDSLLQEPHTLEWQSLGRLRGSVELPNLLIRLPSLRVISMDFREVDPSFLLQLPQLTELHIGSTLAAQGVEEEAADDVAPAGSFAQIPLLQQLPKLTSLELSGCAVSLSELEELVLHLKHLNSLTLCEVYGLTSLRFLTPKTADKPELASTLTSLDLQGCIPFMNVNEFTRVHDLQQLRTLRVFEWFDQEISEDRKKLYRPPNSPIFPSITSCTIDDE